MDRNSDDRNRSYRRRSRSRDEDRRGSKRRYSRSPPLKDDKNGDRRGGQNDRATRDDRNNDRGGRDDRNNNRGARDDRYGRDDRRGNDRHDGEGGDRRNNEEFGDRRGNREFGGSNYGGRGGYGGGRGGRGRDFGGGFDKNRNFGGREEFDRNNRSSRNEGGSGFGQRRGEDRRSSSGAESTGFVPGSFSGFAVEERAKRNKVEKEKRRERETSKIVVGDESESRKRPLEKDETWSTMPKDESTQNQADKMDAEDLNPTKRLRGEEESKEVIEKMDDQQNIPVVV